MYEAFTTEYEREKGQLRTVIPALLTAYPEVGREELMMDERRVLQSEKSAVLNAIRIGVVSDEIGERLLGETNLKLDRVEAGESTVMDGRKGYDEVWRERVRELGIEVDEPDGDADEAAREEQRSLVVCPNALDRPLESLTNRLTTVGVVSVIYSGHSSLRDSYVFSDVSSAKKPNISSSRKR
ncbi:hypothetical protein [Halobaculum limi]|uniref:hypothetical protein n=1 Tax=Halobaculum limi TaxID=3031916 RepID=UPI002405FD88|nr:hypothetical protein [Halobaculum sp. YSMS11]